jgi:hypothetical protein
MSKISKIYSSIHFLFKVGSRKGKTQKQINAMMDQQRPKSQRKRKSVAPHVRKSKSKIDLDKESLTLSEARRVLQVNRKQLDQLLSNENLKLIAGDNLELRITSESIKNWLNINKLQSDILSNKQSNKH